MKSAKKASTALGPAERVKRRIAIGSVAALVGLALVAVDTTPESQPKPGFALLGMALALAGLVLTIAGLHGFGRLGEDAR